MNNNNQNWVSTKDAQVILGKKRGWLHHNKDNYQIKYRKIEGARGLFYFVPSLLSAKSKIETPPKGYVFAKEAVEIINNNTPINTNANALRMNVLRGNWKFSTEKVGNKNVYRKKDVIKLVNQIAA